LLRKHLPQNYRQATQILLESLPRPADPSLSDGDFGDFIYAPFNEFVAKYGCNKDDLEFSLDALYQMTQRFSAEDAIRYFINAYPDQTLARIHQWKSDSHYHVRRLCSEGLRPRLPWAQKINFPIEAALPVLDELFADSTRFVTRSVANHINDISKSNPELAVQSLGRWKKSKRQNPEEMDFIIRHGLRGLVKQGHPDAMKMLGYAPSHSIKASSFKATGKVHRGSALEFSFKVTAPEDCRILIDYVIYFRNKAGDLNKGKVFKLKKLALKKGDSMELRKRHMLHSQMTTRTIYPGQHLLELQINGVSAGKKKFEVL
ncbi:MAG: hypothetical protein KDK33_17640, partial [Leptospiraceae bacterium]|nr:hypothetical protein [Leptospiraceae bacterium]